MSAPSSPVVPPDPPYLPKRTFLSERFIDRHMITVRMIPEAPTSVPAMMSTLLFRTNPVEAAASPEQAFNNAITTGISAPPMGTTSSTPRSDAAASNTQYGVTHVPTSRRPNRVDRVISASPTTTAISSVPTLAPFSPGYRIGSSNTPCSFPAATRLPQKVTAPTRPVTAAAPVTVPVSPLVGPAAPTRSTSSAPATSADAPPPKPLNNPTS